MSVSRLHAVLSVLAVALAWLQAAANLAKDAMYFVQSGTVSGDADLRLTFDAMSGMPPVRAFWSVTLYDAVGNLVANDLNRYSLGSESGLKEDDQIHHDLPPELRG